MLCNSEYSATDGDRDMDEPEPETTLFDIDDALTAVPGALLGVLAFPLLLLDDSAAARFPPAVPLLCSASYSFVAICFRGNLGLGIQVWCF